MLPFADEEVYSAEFVYESIYEEIPAEVSEVKVKPFPALAPLTRTPQTTRTCWDGGTLRYMIIVEFGTNFYSNFI